MTFTYYGNTFYVLTSNLSFPRGQGGYSYLSNTYLPYSVKFPYVVSASTITDGENEAYFQFSYGKTDDNLENIDGTFYGAGTIPELDRLPFFSGITNSEESVLTINIDFDYTDPVLPYHTTNTTQYLNGRFQGEDLITYYTYSNSLISKIIDTDSSGNETVTLTYNSNRLLTRMCIVSCQDYNYDSSGRLTSTTVDGETIESVTYNTVNGVSQVKTLTNVLGTWTFSY